MSHRDTHQNMSYVLQTCSRDSAFINIFKRLTIRKTNYIEIGQPSSYLCASLQDRQLHSKLELRK